jgi:hypothetical protein
MSFGQPDRVPLFPEGIRDEVLHAWRKQGLARGVELDQVFHFDQFEEISPNLDPIPYFRRWPANSAELTEYQRRLNPEDPRRLPTDWVQSVQKWRQREHALFLRVHEGFFLTMGVNGWRRFDEAIRLLVDDPAYVHTLLNTQGEFAAHLADCILQQVEVDAAIISEPISSSHGPLISPRMYADFVLRSYQPIWDVLEKHSVNTLILRTYANSRPLFRVVRGTPINCLWSVECEPAGMDYFGVRAEFGDGIRLIGGFDTDVLRMGKEAIRKEIDDKVCSLLARGGYIPLADGRVREFIPYENYVYYRKLLEEVTS